MVIAQKKVKATNLDLGLRRGWSGAHTPLPCEALVSPAEGVLVAAALAGPFFRNCLWQEEAAASKTKPLPWPHRVGRWDCECDLPLRAPALGSLAYFGITVKGHPRP